MLSLLLLLLSGIRIALAIRIGRIPNATFVSSSVSQIESNITYNQCTCRALSIQAVGWNYLASMSTCELIMNYSVTDTGLTPTTNTAFIFQQLPPHSTMNSTVAQTTTTTTTVAPNYTCATARWNQTFMVVAGALLPGLAPNRLDAPGGIRIDPLTSDLFIADWNNNRAQKWNAFAGNGTTKAGNASGFSGSANDRLNKPSDVAWDSLRGWLYVADTANHRVVRVNTTAGTVVGTIVAGTGSAGTTLAQLSAPTGITLDTTGTYLYVADTGNHRVLRWNLVNLTTNGVLIAGITGVFGFAPTQLDSPRGLALNQQNTVLFIADMNNHRVQRLLLGSSFVTTAAGSPGGFAGITSLRLYEPAGIALDLFDNLYVADSANSRIQMFCPNRTNATTIVSSSVLQVPLGIAFDASFNLYVADTQHNRILMFALLA